MKYLSACCALACSCSRVIIVPASPILVDHEASYNAVLLQITHLGLPRCWSLDKSLLPLCHERWGEWKPFENLRYTLLSFSKFYCSFYANSRSAHLAERPIFQTIILTCHTLPSFIEFMIFNGTHITYKQSYMFLWDTLFLTIVRARHSPSGAHWW